MGKNSKRPKSYYVGYNKKPKFVSKNEIGFNRIGFLGTSGTYGFDCIKEAYILLNDVANRLYGEEELPDRNPKKRSEVEKTENSPEKDKKPEDEKSETSETSDLENDLAEELSALQPASKTDARPPRRFQQVPSGAKNCIFVSTTLDDPLKLCLAIMDDIIEAGVPKTKHLCKFFPVHTTCKATVKEITDASVEVIRSKLQTGTATYYIDLKCRNSSPLEKGDVAIPISEALKDVNPDLTVDYKEPDYVIFLNVIKTTCFVSLLAKYHLYAKYNLNELIQKNVDNVEIKGAEVAIDEVKEAEDANVEVKEAEVAIDEVKEAEDANVEVKEAEVANVEVKGAEVANVEVKVAEVANVEVKVAEVAKESM